MKALSYVMFTILINIIAIIVMRRIPWLVKVLLTTLLILCCIWIYIFFLEPDEGKGGDPICKKGAGNMVPDRNLERMFNRGINKDLYFEAHRHWSIPMDEYSTSDLAQWRAKKLKEGIKEHLEEVRSFQNNGAGFRWYAQLSLDPLIENETELRTQLLGREGLVSRFILLYEQEAHYDCKTRDYHYKVTYLILKNSLLVLPEEVRRLIMDTIDRIYDEKIEVLSRTGRVTINIYSDVFHELLGNEEFKRQLRQQLSKDARDSLTVLDYLDPPTQDFFRNLLEGPTIIKSFGTGEYVLSGDMTYLLETFAHRFLQLRDIETNYRIVSKGFADIRPVKGEIIYDGWADLSLNQDEIMRLSMGQPRKGGGRISNNRMLSIARGYSGARIIHRILENQLVGEERETVRLYYSGGGEIGVAPLDAYRRIELVIRKER